MRELLLVLIALALAEKVARLVVFILDRFFGLGRFGRRLAGTDHLWDYSRNRWADDAHERYRNEAN